MREFARPKVVASKCLEFAACRYNEAMISSAVVRLLEPHVEFMPVCPEVEIGLPVPRSPIRIVKVADQVRLLQPETGRDVSKAMSAFSESFLSTLQGVDGFILKSRSPSCGIKDVKIYPGTESTVPISKGSGFFGGAVLDRLAHLPVEDEGRLKNHRIREHFLIVIFMLASFQRAKAKGAMRHLVKFHSENKLLLMAYNQKVMREMGKVVANHEKRPLNQVLSLYEDHLAKAVAKIPRYTSCINVLMHAMGHFSKSLSSREKKYLIATFEEFRAKRIPLSVPLSILKAHIVRFGDPYLMEQTFFEPFPEELLSVTDSGKGRDL